MVVVTPGLARANAGWRPLKLSESLAPVSEADVAFPAFVSRCEWCMLGGVAASGEGQPGGAKVFTYLLLTLECNMCWLQAIRPAVRTCSFGTPEAGPEVHAGACSLYEREKKKKKKSKPRLASKDLLGSVVA